MQFEVLREHIGDRFYKAGDVREVDEISVNHLVRNGVLRPISKSGKSSSPKQPAKVSVAAKGRSENVAKEPKAEDITASDTATNSELETAPEVKAEDKAEADKQDAQKAESTLVQNKSQGAAPKNKGS